MKVYIICERGTYISFHLKNNDQESEEPESCIIEYVYEAAKLNLNLACLKSENVFILHHCTL